MNKIKKVKSVVVGESEESFNGTPIVEVETVDFDSFAYSMYEDEDGTFHAIEIPFSTKDHTAGDVRVIESNTDKFIIQERIQINLMNNDMS